VNTEGDRRELPFTSFSAANLPNWVEQARLAIIAFLSCSRIVINIVVWVLFGLGLELLMLMLVWCGVVLVAMK